MVEQVEKLCPEFDVESLCDRGLLEYREVKIDHALLSQGRVDARFIAKSESRSVSEATGVEPSSHSRYGAARG